MAANMSLQTWNPKSKTDPYAQSCVELMKLAKETVDDFFEIPIGISDDLVQNLAERLEAIFQDYTTFVASCGKRLSFMYTCILYMTISRNKLSLF